MFELETGIANWRRRLERRSSLSPRELDELEDHLRARVDLELELNPDLTPYRALVTAREGLGAPAALAMEFTRAGRPRWRYLLLAGWAMYGASFILPIAGPAALQTMYTEVPWSAPAHEWLQRALVDGWILPLIPNLAMAMTLPALLYSWRSRARWLTWTIGAFGVSALGFGVASLLDGSAVTSAGEVTVFPYLGLGYWAWSAAHALVAAALLLRSRAWVSARSGARRARNVELARPRPITGASWCIAVLLSGTALVACADGADVDGDRSPPIELAASAVEVLGTSDSLAVVRDLEVLADGSVWVLNSQEPYFMGFGAGGESLGAHGSAGGGPDEFPMPAAFVTGGWEGGAWVLDLLHHALIRISRPGAGAEQFSLVSPAVPRGSVRSGMSMLDPSVRTARFGREIIVPHSTATMDGGVLQFRYGLLGADLVAVDPETGGTRTLVALGDVLDDPSGDFIQSDGGFPLWYRLWASCGENLVRVYDRVRNQLRGFDGSGAEVDPIELPPVPFTEVTPRQFAGAVFALRQAEVTGDVATRLTTEDSLRLVNQMADMVQGAPHELASYLPRYVDFRCSEDGTMWLRPMDLDAGGLSGGPMWLRIEPDGAARHMRLPDRFDALRFTPSRIWGVSRDEFDRSSVASIALPPG